MTETAQRAGHIPGATSAPWAQTVNEDGTLQGRRRAAGALRGQGRDRRQGRHRLLPDRRALEPLVVRAARAAGLPQGPQLRRLVDRVGVDGQRAHREGLPARLAHAPPYSGTSCRRGPAGHCARPGSGTSRRQWAGSATPPSRPIQDLADRRSEGDGAAATPPGPESPRRSLGDGAAATPPGPATPITTPPGPPRYTDARTVACDSCAMPHWLLRSTNTIPRSGSIHSRVPLTPPWVNVAADAGNGTPSSAKAPTVRRASSAGSGLRQPSA